MKFLNLSILINKKLFFCYVIFALFISCSNHIGETYDEIAQNIHENEIWNPIIVLSRKEKIILEASSKKLYKNSNKMTLMVGDVEIDFFNEDGGHISILYSDSAQIDESNNNLYANGNVFIVSDSGYTLRTNQLLWDNRYEMIVAEDSVMFTHIEGDTLYGIGFESDIDLERFKIFRPFGIVRQGI